MRLLPTILTLSLVSLLHVGAQFSPVPVAFTNCKQDSAFTATRVLAEYNHDTHELNFAIEGNISYGLVGLNTEKYATSFVTIDMAGVQQYKNRFEFCNTTNVPCPWGPGLVSFGNKVQLPDSYVLSTLSTNVFVLDENTPPNQIICVNFDVTPSSSSSLAIIVWIPSFVLIIVALTNLVTMLINPWTGTLDIAKATSGVGMNVNTLRSITPGLYDIVLHLQFLVSLAQLSMTYPGFFISALSSLGFVDLIFAVSFTGGPLIADGAYVDASVDSIARESFSTSLDGLPANIFNETVTNDIVSFDPNNFGLQNFANLIGISSRDLFPTFMVLFFCVAAGVTVVNFILWLFGAFLEASDSTQKQIRQKHYYYWLGSLLRVFMFFYFPLAIFSFFQLSIHNDSGTISLVFAALAVGGLVFAVPIFLLYQLHIGQASLYDSQLLMFAFGPLYNVYRGGGASFFCGVIFLHHVVKAIVIGAGQSSGITQGFVLVAGEIGFLICLISFKPYCPRTGMNALSVLISAIRIIISILILPFISEFGVKPDALQWISYVILFINCVILFIFLLCSLKTIVEIIMRKCGVPMTDDDNSNIPLSGFGGMVLKSGRGFRRRMNLLDYDDDVTPTRKSTLSRLVYDESSYFKNGDYYGQDEMPMRDVQRIQAMYTYPSNSSSHDSYMNFGQFRQRTYENRGSAYSSVESETPIISHTASLGISRPPPETHFEEDYTPQARVRPRSETIVSPKSSGPSPSIWHDKLLSNSNLPKRQGNSDDDTDLILTNVGKKRATKLRQGQACLTLYESGMKSVEHPRRLSAPLLDQYINDKSGSVTIGDLSPQSSPGHGRNPSTPTARLLSNFSPTKEEKKSTFASGITGLLSKIIPKGSSIEKESPTAGFVVRNRKPLDHTPPISTSDTNSPTIAEKSLLPHDNRRPNTLVRMTSSSGCPQLINAFGAGEDDDDDDADADSHVSAMKSTPNVKRSQHHHKLSVDSIEEGDNEHIDDEDDYLEAPPSLAALASTLAPSTHDSFVTDGPTDQQQYQLPYGRWSLSESVHSEQGPIYRITNPDSNRTSQVSLSERSLKHLSGAASHRSSGATLYRNITERSPSARLTREVEPEHGSFEGGEEVSTKTKLDPILKSTKESLPKLTMPPISNLQRKTTTDTVRRARRTALFEAVKSGSRPKSSLEDNGLFKRSVMRSETLDTLDSIISSTSTNQQNSAEPTSLVAQDFEQEIKGYFDTMLGSMEKEDGKV